MGKFFAAVIIVLTAGWLVPMCAGLPDDLKTFPAPAESAAPAAPEPEPEPVAPEPVPEPVPVPELKPAAKGDVSLSTFRMRTMFPEENGKFVVSVVRANRSAEEASGVRMTLTTRKDGALVERAESGPAQTLAAGSTSYFGLAVSTLVLDEILDAPADPGTGLEWSLVYRLAGDAPEATRCFRLNALPRRRDPVGIDWVAQRQSRKCAP